MPAYPPHLPAYPPTYIDRYPQGLPSTWSPRAASSPKLSPNPHLDPNPNPNVQGIVFSFEPTGRVYVFDYVYFINSLVSAGKA